MNHLIDFMNCIFDCVNYDVIPKDYQLFGNIYENMTQLTTADFSETEV